MKNLKEEIDYNLQLLRDELPSLFDENGERYKATPISNDTAKLMLKLINDFDSYASKLKPPSQ